MPRLDDPDIKLKPLYNFKRQNLRPWDDPSDFIPNRMLEDNINNNSKTNEANKDISNIDIKTNSKRKVNENETNSKRKVNENETNSKHTLSQTETNSKPTLDALVISNKTIGKRNSKQSSSIDDEDLNEEPTNYKEIFKNTKLLVGLQKKALFYIVENCKIGGTLCTSPITSECLKEILGTDNHSVKTTIQRLVNKNLIKRKEGKKGNGGYSIFSISETVRNLVTEICKQNYLYSQAEINSKQTVNEIVNNKKTDKETNGCIVSSNYINTTTYIPEDFKEIDCSPLQDIGFDESHIIQIYREHNQKPNLALSAEIIQNSINALAFDLKYNNAASSFKASPAVVLTAMLKKGQPYSSKTPEKVLSPREAAMQEYLLSQEQKNLKIMETETKAFELARKEWLGSLSEEELLSFNEDENVCPSNMHEKIYQISRRQQALANAKKYFDNIIWPQKLKEILGR